MLYLGDGMKNSKDTAKQENNNQPTVSTAKRLKTVEEKVEKCC